MITRHKNTWMSLHHSKLPSLCISLYFSCCCCFYLNACVLSVVKRRQKEKGEHLEYKSIHCFKHPLRSMSSRCFDDVPDHKDTLSLHLAERRNSNSLNSSVPPHFIRPGGVGDAASSPGAGADVREVILNNPVSLYCDTNAVPPPTLTWYKDGRLLASNHKALILPGGTKQLRQTQWEKDGMSSY